MNAREEYSARLAGFPHPDGKYSGEYRTENGRTWFYIAADNGMDYETEDAPEEVIVLGGGVAHDEQVVKDFAGQVIYAVSNIPLYWWKHKQQQTTAQYVASYAQPGLLADEDGGPLFSMMEG